MNKILGYIALGVSSLLQLLGFITQPDHLGDKVDESGFICRRIGHDGLTTNSSCRRCKRYLTALGDWRN